MVEIFVVQAREGGEEQVAFAHQRWALGAPDPPARFGSGQGVLDPEIFSRARLMRL